MGPPAFAEGPSTRPRRVACVDVPALALQRLLQREPSWATSPMAVVDEDKPTGRIEWVNQRAWRLQIRPGMRYAAALSLSGTLRAGVVSAEERALASTELVEALERFSPRVEPVPGGAGAFWLDASGLERLTPSLASWAAAIGAALDALGYRATVVVGFRKFAVYALAMARYRTRVLGSPEAEQRAVRRAPVDRMELPADVLRFVERMGVRTLGQLLALSRAELVQRFGVEAGRLHLLSSEAAERSVQAQVRSAPIEALIDWDHAERNTARLTAAIRARLPGLMGQLVARDAQLKALELHLELEGGGRLSERLEPAAPTLDEALVLELVGLRLESACLSHGVSRVRIVALPQRAKRTQLSLVELPPRRDLKAANRALARLRAELGDDAVGRLEVADGHLPEARARWRPLVDLRAAAPERVHLRPLIRRVQQPSQPLPPRARIEPDGWLVRGPEAGPVTQSFGPHVVDGGWWATPIEREYHFLETAHGHLYWTFYDRRRRRWFLQGEVE